MTSKTLAQWCAWHAGNRKGEDIAILDVAAISSITDFFVIITGTSEPHLRAIRDEVRDQLQVDESLKPRAEDGSLETGWLVLDYFDVIVHVMTKDARQRYGLESLWGDAPRVSPRKPATRSATKKSAKKA